MNGESTLCKHLLYDQQYRRKNFEYYCRNPDFLEWMQQYIDKDTDDEEIFIMAAEILLKDSGPKLSMGEIEAFEAKIGIRLSDCYRNFLLKNNGGIPLAYPSGIDIQDAPFQTTDIQVFLRIGSSIESSDLLYEFEFVNERWDWIKLIPFAHESSGNSFYFIEDNSIAKQVVYVENHVYGLHMYHVANNFDEFISNIYLIRWRDEQIANEEAGLSETPDGYTWYHNEDGENMELIPKDVHKKTLYNGSVPLMKR